MKTKKVLLLICAFLCLQFSISQAVGESNEIGQLAVRSLGDLPFTGENLFDTLHVAYEVDYFDMDVRTKIDICRSNATFEIIESGTFGEGEDCGRGCWSDSGYEHEHYVIKVDIVDAFVHSEYTVRFSLMEDYHMNEFAVLSSHDEYFNDDVRWTSMYTTTWDFVSDVKPDGNLLVTCSSYGLNASSDSFTVDPLKVSKSSDGVGYYYETGFPTLPIYLFNDGYIRYLDDEYYPEGVEDQLHVMDSSSGNLIGNTSSNLYAGGQLAIEGETKLWAVDSFQEYVLKRSYLDLSNEYVLALNDQYSYLSLNLVNGNCFISWGHSMVEGYNLNGDCFFSDEGEYIVADTNYAFYTRRNEGLFRYDIAAGMIDHIADGDPRFVCMDGDWVYWFDNGIRRISKQGGDVQTLVKDRYIAGFIVDQGILLYWTDDQEYYKADDLYLVYCDESGAGQPQYFANKSEFGGTFYSEGQNVPYMALHNGWIYYYYPSDTTLICRRNVNDAESEQFVCYCTGECKPLSIFGDKLYLDYYDDGFDLSQL